jgi:hypothetical protein
VSSRTLKGIAIPWLVSSRAIKGIKGGMVREDTNHGDVKTRTTAFFDKDQQQGNSQRQVD